MAEFVLPLRESMAKYNFKKDIQKIVKAELADYVADKCVPTCSKMIKEKCNQGYATGNLADSVYYDKQGDLAYIVYVEAFDKYGTNYAKFADQGRGVVRPVYAKILRWSDGSYHMRSGPAKGANFIKATVSKLKH